MSTPADSTPAPADSFPHVITASINMKLMPIDRGERFEDPLEEVLTQVRLGHVTGGGTQMLPSHEVEHCDLEIELTNLSPETLQTIVQALEAFGAPKGSRLHLGEDRKPIDFGINEGMAIYLNGTDLPPETYANSDVNQVINELHEHLGEVGVMQAYWEGPRETALYFYGPSYEEMKDRVAFYLARTPLCEECRVVRIA